MSADLPCQPNDDLASTLDLTSASETIEWALATARQRFRSCVRRALIAASGRRSIDTAQLEAVARAQREVGALELLARCAADLRRSSR